MQTDIHVLSGIRTHDPSARADEEGSRLRPRDHCDRQYILYNVYILSSINGLK
jgi:hypothetical protein